MAAGTVCDPGAVRPDLTIPLVRTSQAMTRGLTGLREPAFDLARRQNSRLVAVAAALLVVGQLAVVDPLRTPVTSLALVLAVYVVLRAVSLTRLERRQRAFEPTWLVERSADLRGTEFDLVQLVVAERVYDLADAADLAALSGTADGGTRCHIGFRHAPANLEWVVRRLREVRIEPVLRPGAAPRVRFPAARYGATPESPRTFWSLGAPVVVIVATPAGPGAARGGTGSTGRPAAVRRGDGRRPGTP